MSDIDALITERLVPARKRVVDALIERHPHTYGFINRFLSGQENKLGIKVTDNEAVVGEYTFYLDGLYVKEVEKDRLDSELHLPIGVIRPYGIIEKDVLEKIANDEEAFKQDVLATARKYLPRVTIKFLR